MSKLGAVLGWKHNHVEGLTTDGDTIRDWPASLGARPTQAQINTWTAEYDAAQLEVQKQERIDRTNVGMSRWVEHLTVLLLQKALLLRSDIPQPVLDAINARRAERDQAPI